MSVSQPHDNYQPRKIFLAQRQAISFLIRLHQGGRAVKGMLYLMNRMQALQQLSQWASNKYYSRRGKKFLHIRLSYEKQREILDSKLSLLRFRYPRLYWVARILYYVSNLVTVNPVYSPGSAASYRRRVTS